MMGRAAGMAPAVEGDFADAFGAFLVSRGLVDEFALRRAQQARARTGERLDLVLSRLGLLAEADLASALAEHLAVPLAGSSDMPLVALFRDSVPRSFVLANRLLPISSDGHSVVVAVADPFATEPISALGYLLDKTITLAIGAPRDIELAIERLYAAGSETKPGIAAVSGAADAQDEDVRRLQDLASDAPIIRLVQDLITRAVEAKASDIHVEPRDDYLEVRFRIDGALHTVERLSQATRAGITSRIKVMARLDIAERRLPQDGRVTVPVRGHEIDLRVSTMPTMNGESLVLRILDRSSVKLDFEALGFSGSVLRSLKALIEAPSGIVLVTGPTGSGKTTTLYTALGSLNDRQRKIFTVEDPIEYQIDGISQVHVEPKIGLGFATALRAILRQDPDILMVGEIRDLETAKMAVQASLTGHLVLSTVHTNSAAATIARLINMGVDDYLLASSLTGVVAQRLVRRLCQQCSEPADLSTAVVDRLVRDAGAALELRGLGHDGLKLRRKVGCSTCRGTGYDGRLSVNELLTLDAEIGDAILSRVDERSIEARAVASGMVTMYQDGIVKALLGSTTMEEVLRVTRVPK